MSTPIKIETIERLIAEKNRTFQENEEKCEGCEELKLLNDNLSNTISSHGAVIQQLSIILNKISDAAGKEIPVDKIPEFIKKLKAGITYG